MGAGIASRLLATGHGVHARDIDPARENAVVSAGAIRHADPASLAGSADTIFIVVVTAAEIDNVLGGETGLLNGLRRSVMPAHKTILLCSTIAPHDTIRLAEQITGTGAAVIDAPISGGPARAYDGSMSMMMAGAPDAIARCQSVIDAVAARQFRISERIGDGAKSKLVNNLAAGIHMVAAAEALTMAAELGLDVSQMQQLMSVSSGQSWMADDRMPRALAGDYAPRAATRVLTKDLTLAMAVAKQAGVHVPLGTEALGLFESACDAGYAEEDDAAMYQYFQDLRPGT